MSPRGRPRLTVKKDLPALYFYIGRRLRQYREKAGLSQAELADKTAYISRTSIVQIETGKQRVSIEDLFVLAMTLGIQPGKLLPVASPVILLNKEDAFLEYLESGGANREAGLPWQN